MVDYISLKDNLKILEASANYIYTDKDSSGYLDIYDNWFKPFQSKDGLKILEIGVKRGGSIMLWNQYFENALVYGADNNHGGQRTFDFANAPKNVEVFYLDQENREDLQLLVDNFGQFDIIIDDGGHSMPQQQISFGFLFPFIKTDGMYIIEDLGTCTVADYHINEHKVKPDGSNTTLKMIDDFNKTDIIKSEYMTEEEEEYLSKNITSYELRKTGKASNVNNIIIDFETCAFYKGEKNVL